MYRDVQDGTQIILFYLLQKKTVTNFVSFNIKTSLI